MANPKLNLVALFDVGHPRSVKDSKSGRASRSVLEENVCEAVSQAYRWFMRSLRSSRNPH